MECTEPIVITLQGDPRTKKNSPRIARCGRYSKILPSESYEKYSIDCMYQIVTRYKRNCIDSPINLKCVYYMQTRRRVDLANLLEATCDILVDAGIIADDNSNIIVSHDGSRVKHDKTNPRVEIEIAPSFLYSNDS